MNADSYNTLTLSTVGEALCALDRELRDLAVEDDRLMRRRKLLRQKMEICHNTMKQLLSNAGVAVVEKEWPRFPELSHEE